MDKIKKIRQEIERLKKQEKENEKAELMSDSWILGRQVMLEHFEHFLNTLSEEPCKSLEEAAEEYIKNGRYLPEAWVVRPAFIAGAEWQASQMPMPEDTVLFNKGVAEGRRLERADMLNDAYNYSDLYAWYIHNVSVYDKPLWSEKHLKELLKDFIVIPKENNEDGSK